MRELIVEHSVAAEDTSAAHTAYNVLKERIVTATARPGSVISDVTVAKELGMGRSPVREALQRLARERLMTIVPRRGAFVSELQVFELQQIFEVRVEMEGLCARLAAERATLRDIAELRAILAEEDAVSLKHDAKAIIPLDRHLHQAIIHTAQNTYLGDSLEPLRNISTRAWYLNFERYGHLSEMRSEHDAIVDAIARRDAVAAEDAMRRHVLSFRDKLRSLY